MHECNIVILGVNIRGTISVIYFKHSAIDSANLGE